MGEFLRYISPIGCTVRAYDPTDEVDRPSNSYLPNLHFYPLAIGPRMGTIEFPGGKTFKMNSLGNFIKGKAKISIYVSTSCQILISIDYLIYRKWGHWEKHYLSKNGCRRNRAPMFR